jgi:signal transduction histidine kinase
VSRFVPRSLLAQMALVVGIALLLAQLVNFGLILNEREKVSLAQNQGPAITRFASIASDYARTPADLRFAVIEDNSRRGARFAAGTESSVQSGMERDEGVETRLRAALQDVGLAPLDVRATTRTTAPSAAQGNRRSARNLLILSANLPGVGWFDGTLSTPRADPWLRARLLAATLALYVIVLGATLFAISRLVRPLRDLTRAAERFGGREEVRPVVARGPADVRRAIDAFNAMNRRVEALLDEKDRMLGAIGHDLRTPLASLRIRAEGVEPDSERARMVATIDELATTLEDILVLARTGRAREEARPVDVSALADAVVEEFRELGGKVSFAEAPRIVASVQPLLLRRALRNLVDNALKYGLAAHVSVTAGEGEVRIAVADEGAGLSADEMEQVLEPFYRAEGSRSRDTGGAGLGLAIARAIAEGHGGTLKLENGVKGLAATISIPFGHTAQD